MDQPLVSVVLPTFNGSKYLADSIESVRAQTLENWELIVVDDGSTDASLGIALGSAQKDSRIRVISNGQNLRLPRSLNRGFDAAHGKYFTWTSDDNLFLPAAFEEMVRVLEEGCDFVYSDQAVIDEDGKEIGKFVVRESESMLESNPINACFMYRREVHEALGGYDPDLFLAEDWDFWLRAWLEFKMRPIHSKLYLYRKHAGSLSSQRRAECTRAFLSMVEKNWATISRTASVAADALVSVSNAHRVLGESAKARQAAGRALWTAPLYSLRRHPREIFSNLLKG